MEGLKNLMEDDVERFLDQLLPGMPNVCSCNDCRLDMATYALNRLHPKYARTNTGAVLHKFDVASPQGEAEILAMVVSAINVIGNNPHHPQQQATTNDNAQAAAPAADNAQATPAAGNAQATPAAGAAQQ